MQMGIQYTLWAKLQHLKSPKLDCYAHLWNHSTYAVYRYMCMWCRAQGLSHNCHVVSQKNLHMEASLTKWGVPLWHEPTLCSTYKVVYWRCDENCGCKTWNGDAKVCKEIPGDRPLAIMVILLGYKTTPTRQEAEASLLGRCPNFRGWNSYKTCTWRGTRCPF